MMRYTDKDCKKWAKDLADILGKKFDDYCWTEENGKNKAIVGCWRLSYNPIYGGCVIEEIVNEAGGASRPLGERLPPREFVNAVNFAIKAIMIYEKEKLGKK